MKNIKRAKKECERFIKFIKNYFFPLVLLGSLLSSCTEDEPQISLVPEIFIKNKIDTAFLNTTYVDQEAEVLGLGTCMNVQVTGRVNTYVLGTYVLDYDYTDPNGNKAATVTRTVHVVENSAAFLNGIYKASCTCTATNAEIGKVASSPTVTVTDYTATISTAKENGKFELISLRIGPEDMVPSASVSGNSITVYFYHQNFVVGTNEGKGTGTLSSTKDTFEIENTAYQISPAIKYKCRNSYVRQPIRN